MPIDLSMLPHEDRGPAIRTGIWILTAFATIFLSLRVYCKFAKSHRLNWDDWVLIAAYVSCGGYYGLPTHTNRRGESTQGS